MTELFNSLNSLVTPELLAETAAQLDESEDSVQKAVGAVTLLLLIALGKRAELPGGAQAVLDLSQRVRQLMGTTVQPVSTLSGAMAIAKMAAAGRDHDWATILLTTEATTEAIAATLAAYINLPPDAATSLLRLVVPAMLALLAQYTAASSLTTNDFAGKLLALASQARTNLPGYLVPLGARLGLYPAVVPVPVPVAPAATWLAPASWPVADLPSRRAPGRLGSWHWQ